MNDKIPIPLYWLAYENRLPELQIMDNETLQRIKSRIKFTNQKMKNVFPLYEPFSKNRISKFIPSKSLFAQKNHFDSIHGISHTIRVMINALVLCQLLNYPSEDVLLASALHDVRRLNDKGDLLHGERCAQWLTDNYQNIPSAKNFKPEKIKKIAQIIKHHDTLLENIPKSHQYNYSLHILRAADALDRYRLPKIKWWPKLEYIKIPEAQKLFNLSKIFVHYSELEHVCHKKPKEISVLETAKKIGYLV